MSTIRRTISEAVQVYAAGDLHRLSGTDDVTVVSGGGPAGYHLVGEDTVEAEDTGDDYAVAVGLDTADDVTVEDAHTAEEPAEPGPPVAIYYPGYSRDDPQDPGRTSLDNVNWDALSIVIDFSVGLDDGALSATWVDDNGDTVGNGWSPSAASDLTAAAHAAGRRAVLCLGSHLTSDSFNANLDTSAKRAAIAAELADWMDLYGYDGVDLDGEPAAEIPDYQAFLIAVRDEFASRGWRTPGPDYRTISLICFGVETDVAKDAIANGADWVSPMLYVPWEDTSRHLSPIEQDGYLGAWAVTVDTWSSGVDAIPPHRIWPGFSFYVRRWEGTDGPNQAGTADWTEYDWVEVASEIGGVQAPNATWYPGAEMHGHTIDGAWHSFETDASIAAKASWIAAGNAGGATVWHYQHGSLGGTDHPLAASTAEHFGEVPAEGALIRRTISETVHVLAGGSDYFRLSGSEQIDVDDESDDYAVRFDLTETDPVDVEAAAGTLVEAGGIFRVTITDQAAVTDDTSGFDDGELPQPAPPVERDLPPPRWVVYVRDSGTLTRQGILEFETMDLTLRHLRGAEGEIVCDQAEAGHLVVGAGLIITRNSQTVCSGVITRKGRTRTARRDEIVFRFEDDTYRLRHRLVYPDPTLDADDPDQPDYDRRDGPAGEVIAGYVNDNAGPGARAERQVPGLVVGTVAEGSTVRGRGRWADLVTFARRLGDRAGDVGFWAAQHLGSVPEIRFDVYATQDRPGVRFNIDGESGSGGLAEYDYALAEPDATLIVAGGRGELEDRLIVKDEDDDRTSAWGRIEKWIDRNNDGDEDDVADQLEALQDAVDDEMRDTSPQVDLDLRTVETPTTRWPDHYGLGDHVRVRVEGEWLWRQVRSVQVEITPGGDRIRPRLGDASTATVSRILRRIGEVEERVEERGRI